MRQQRLQRLQRLVVPTFFVVYLAAQIALPIRGLFAPGQARYGWQMYSSLAAIPNVWVDEGAGWQRVDLRRYVWSVRGLKDLGPDTPLLLEEHLCETLEGARAVRIQGRSVQAC